jgi:hypothetical protein
MFSSVGQLGSLPFNGSGCLFRTGKTSQVNTLPLVGQSGTPFLGATLKRHTVVAGGIGSPASSFTGKGLGDLFWEVQFGKGTEAFSRCGVIGQGSFFGSVKSSEVIALNLSCPASFQKGNAFVTRGVVIGPALICSVLRMGTETKIGSPIVESVSVDVIDFDSVGISHQKSMQRDGAFLAIRGENVLGIPLAAGEVSRPLKWAYLPYVGKIDEGVLTPREWNQDCWSDDFIHDGVLYHTWEDRVCEEGVLRSQISPR